MTGGAHFLLVEPWDGSSGCQDDGVRLRTCSDQEAELSRMVKVVMHRCGINYRVLPPESVSQRVNRVAGMFTATKSVVSDLTSDL